MAASSGTTSTFVLGLVGALMFGCVGGGAQMVLKSPIEDQCVSAGLKGCDSIALGATLYADGKPQEGEQKLGAGLRENAEKVAELKKFADGLALVGKVPGAGQYVAPMQPAIRLVQQIAAESAARKASQPVEPTATETPATVANIRNPYTKGPQEPAKAQAATTPTVTAPPVAAAVAIPKFWLVSGNALATVCKFAGTPKMLCMKEPVETPKIVTDVMVSTACSNDVVVASRAGLDYDWLIYAPAGKGAEIHGATLPLDLKRSFYVGVVQKVDDGTSDVRCGVTTVWHSMSIVPEVPAGPQKTQW